MEEIKYQLLDLKSYSSHIYGHAINFETGLPVNLEVGKIKYYNGVPYGQKNMEYYFILATVKAPSEHDSNFIVDKIVGMVELQKSPHDANVIWLDFLSVDPEYKKRGIGKRLAYEMCNFLKDKPWSLERSRPSDEGIKYIKSIIDDLVEKYNIPVIKKLQY